jgi:hypothetical protein
MNLDDPYNQVQGAPAEDDDDAMDEEEGAKKPKAKRRKTSVGGAPESCEYCGNKGHLTKRSQKCTAGLDSQKKYRRDGSLLLAVAEQGVLPAPAPQFGAVAATVVPVDPFAEDTFMAADDVDNIDSQDLGDDVPSDDEDIFHDAFAFASDVEDDGEADVVVVGGSL